MDAPGKLRIATCQFVTDDVDANLAAMEGWLGKAAAQGADLVQFCEAALCAYGGPDLFSWDGFDWERLRRATRAVQDAARRHGVWVVLGSAHCVDAEVRPTNCLYIISPKGEIHDRYDKRMLTISDQIFFTAGDHRVCLDLKGVRLGFLICYDVCFPEMYAAYRDDGVKVMVHSFYNAGALGENVLDEVGPAWLRVRAADNLMHIVATNSSRPHSSWPACVARPDGSLAASLAPHTPGILLHTFPDEELKGWLHNNKSMKLSPDEVFHQGEQSRHPRVANRQGPP